MIAIIDYDAGNLKSVQKALAYLGENAVVTRDKELLLRADKVILPGVGAFADAMEKLHKYDLIEVIHQIINNKTPFLGICLGLQLLFESSDEAPGVAGLRVFKGRIKRIPDTAGLKIPHMGWNSLEIRDGAKLFLGIPQHSYVYFVHSYYLEAEDEAIVAATAEYGTTLHVSVEKDNVFACQFHPEKSGEVGLAILKNFIDL